MANPTRKSGLFSTMVDGQAVIYDSASNRTHCLNPLALKVWQLCDGRHDRDAMVQALGATGADALEDETDYLVDAALDRFADLGLLSDSTHLNRRALGSVAMKGLAAGLVMSVMVPTRAAADSNNCSELNTQFNCEFGGCLWVDDACVPDV